MAKTPKQLIDASAVATKQRNDAAAEVERLHAAMLDEMSQSTDWQKVRYSINLIQAANQQVSNPHPTTAEAVTAALYLFGQLACAMGPLRDETPQQHAMRLSQWAIERWRERGRK